MKLIEHFLSIQGEGAYAGRLAIFVRFGGCNLRCAGFGVRLKAPNAKELIGCDTIKAAQCENFDFKDTNFSELKNIIKSHNAPNAIIVLSGGEPLLHQKNPDFKDFLRFLVEQNRQVHFESNGTIEPDFKALPELKNCYFALSVKLENSGESKEKRINARALKSIFANSKGAFYKFVLSGEGDEIREIKEILAIQNAAVWLMPLGASKNELEITAPKVAGLAIKHGFNYSDRIHIRLWDNKEGV